MRSLLTLALAASAAVAAADPIFRWPFLSSTDPLHIRAARDNDDFPDLHAVGEHRMIAEYAGGVSATAYRDGNNNTGVMAICTNETDKGDSIGVAIMMKGEDSWTHLKYIAVEKLPGLNLASDKPPTAVQLPSGKILVAYLQMGIMPYDFDRFSFYLSSDHGNTWEDLEPVERRRQSDGGGTVTVSLWDAYLRLSRNGTVVQLYYVEGSKEDEGTRTINMMWSDTEGRSWMPGQYDHHTVTQKKRGVLQYHPRIIEWGDDLFCIFHALSPGDIERWTVHIIKSSDDGYSWGNDQKLLEASGDSDVAFPHLLNVNGTLLLTAMTDVAYRDEAQKPPVESADLSLHISGDAGQTWVQHKDEGDIAALERSVCMPWIHYLGGGGRHNSEVLLLYLERRSDSLHTEYNALSIKYELR